MSFVHLNTHSKFSLLYGASPVEKLVSACAESGMEALALTDRDALYAAVPFFEEATAAGIKPIIGCELEVAPPDENARPSRRIILIAQNEKGYSNLCRLVTERHLGVSWETDEYREGKPLPLESLFQHAEGLFALCSEPEMLESLLEIFGGNLYAEISNDGTKKSHLEAEALIEKAHRLGISCVASNRVAFASPKDYKLHLLLNAIRLSKPLAHIPSHECATPESYLKTPEEMKQAFSIYPYTLAPEALPLTAEIARSCDFRFQKGVRLFPKVDIPPGETPFSHLAKLCLEGASRRYRPLSPEALSRLHHELDVIEKLGFTSYFLIVHDIARFCREHGIKAVGRGSAASSMVAYVLGITYIDPLEHNLYFERFLSPAREDPPDIDLDVSWRRRDEVIRYIYRRFGANRVAMICTFATMKSRIALRDAARAFGLSPDETSRLTKNIPHCRASQIESAISTIPSCRGLDLTSEPYRTIFELSSRLDGFPRHLSIHAGGIVVADRPITDLVPLQRAAKGFIITQYDMGPIERLGLLKIDILGQRGLSVIEDSAALVRKQHGEKINTNSLPRNDPETFRLISQGQTIGVFQIESPGMRSLLSALKPRSIEDITLAIALIRPGASGSGMKELFLKRRAGLEPVSYIHKELEPILSESLGTFIYQEQVLKAAAAIANFTLEEADELRRAMTHQRSPEQMNSIRERFIEGAAARGIPKKNARAIFTSLANFAGYGFPKAHAATYAELAYQAAYLKAHYPAEFMACVLSNDAGFYHHSVYIEEAKRLGVRVCLPDINRSEADYSVVSGMIYIGLSRIKGVRKKTIDSIISARAEFPFTSLSDFLSRVDISEEEVAALIKAGAFDTFENTRPELLWKLRMIYPVVREARAPARHGTPEKSTRLFDPTASIPRVLLPRIPDYSPAEKLRMELELLEASVSSHPLEILAPYWISRATVNSTRIDSKSGKTVTAVGWVIARRRVVTKDGRYMQFLTLEDLHGTYEAIIFPDDYQKLEFPSARSRALLIKGTVREHAGAVSIIAKDIEPIGIEKQPNEAIPPHETLP